LIPILAVILTNSEAALPQRLLLAAVYSPYFIFPLWITWLAAETSTSSPSPMKPPRGTAYTAFFLFFLSHIPITLIMGGQAILPSFLYPKTLVDLVAWYAQIVGDPLMTRPFDIWFTALVACEVFFQLPFFMFMVQVMKNKQPWSNGIRSLCIIYGSHVTTSMVPVFVTLIANPDSSRVQKIVAVNFYLPYLAFPVWLIYLAIHDALTVGTAGKAKPS
jgi:hypothetical protein